MSKLGAFIVPDAERSERTASTRDEDPVGFVRRFGEKTVPALRG